MKALHEVHQKDNRIKELQQDQEINQLRIRRNLALVIALAGFLYAHRGRVLLYPPP